jgi:hypothetical protein
MAADRDADRTPPGRSSPRVRLLASAAVLALAGTYLAAQIDLVRRHQPGIAPFRYWLPQVQRIWLPGVGLALVLGIAAFLLHRRSRPK